MEETSACVGGVLFLIWFEAVHGFSCLKNVSSCSVEQLKMSKMGKSNDFLPISLRVGN
jgi:hypothetical protein